MNPTLNVYGLPRYVTSKELAGVTVVVIDVLRAATVTAYALGAGAKQVLPCREIEDALKEAERFASEEVVLGGEREGVAIDGFQLGNSPEEYTPECVAGKTVILTTTNGTRALDHARQAAELYLASFVDVSAVVSRLIGRPQIAIVCAGTNGNISDDDVLLAGLLVDQLLQRSGIVYQQNAQAITARESWLGAFALPRALGAEPLEPDRLNDRLRKTLGAQNLIALGLDRDIAAAAQIDRFPFAPKAEPQTLRTIAG